MRVKNSAIRILLLIALVLLPSVVFFVALMTNQYLLAFFAFVIVTVDLLHKFVLSLEGALSELETDIDLFFRRVAEAVLISSFGFAALASWSLVIPILLFSVFLNYFRLYFIDKKQKPRFLRIQVFETVVKIAIVFLAFSCSIFSARACTSFMPFLETTSLTISEITLVTLFVFLLIVLVLQIMDSFGFRLVKK